MMKNVDNVMAELTDVVVTICGEEVNLGDLTYGDFSDMVDELPEDEVKEILDQIVEEIGEEAFVEFLKNLGVLDDLEQELGEREKEDKPSNNTKQELLPPVRFVDMNDFYSYDPELITTGINSISVQVGQYMACVNAGMTPTQAFELITAEDKHRRELEVLDKQIELRKIESELQLSVSGVKQLLSR